MAVTVVRGAALAGCVWPEKPSAINRSLPVSAPNSRTRCSPQPPPSRRKAATSGPICVERIVVDQRRSLILDFVRLIQPSIVAGHSRLPVVRSHLDVRSSAFSGSS